MILPRSVRIGAPLVVVAGLIASFASFFSAQNDLVQARDNHRGGPLWMAVRLEIAIVGFDSELAAFAAGATGVTAADVNRKFDVLWSRWDLAHHGKAGSWLRDIDQESQAIAQLGDTLAAQEENVLNLRQGDTETAFALRQAFGAFRDPLHDLSLSALRETSDTEVSVRNHLVNTANKLTAIAISIVVISFVLAGYFWVNALAQRRIAQEKSKLFVQAQAGYKAKSEFVATISHELRTPLTSIIGAFDLLGSGVIVQLPEKASGLVKLGRGGCDRLSNLIENLLDIEMFEKGALKLAYQPFDLVDAITEVQGMTAEAAKKNQIELQTEFEGEYFEVEADWRRLNQALAAIVDNAIKFSEKGSKVQIRLRAVNGSRFELCIKDSGIGIAEDQHERIFDKFTLGDSSDQRAHAGVGNGLFIADAVIRAHGGEIKLQSKVGEGTEVSVIIPAQAAPAKTDETHDDLIAVAG